MKTINAAYFPSIGVYDEREFYRGSPLRAAIKRRARRFERRAATADLRSNLPGYVDEGIEAFKRSLRSNKAKTVPAMTVTATPDVMQAEAAGNAFRSQAYAGMDAKIIPFPTRAREILVVRKRPFHRATTESLRLAA